MNNELIEYIDNSYHVKIDAESYIKYIYASNYDQINTKKSFFILDFNTIMFKDEIKHFIE